MELLPLSVGIGLVASLIFTEMFGMAAGGMVVPGYVALHIAKPLDVILTLGSGFATFALVRALSSIAIVYGRRRTVIMILVGYLLGMALRQVTQGMATQGGQEYLVIGYIIPGLIAIWLDRQGVLETVFSLITAAVAVRLVLILVMGSELNA